MAPIAASADPRRSTRHRSIRSLHSIHSSSRTLHNMVAPAPSPSNTPPAVRDGAVALPNVPHVVTLGGARVVLWDTAKRRADRLASEHIQALVSLLVHGADKQREDVAAILANAACDKYNRRELALAGAVPLLVRAVAQADTIQHKTFVGKLLRALANLAWHNDANQLEIEASGGVDLLVELLANDTHDLEIQDEAATALSHLLDHSEIARRVYTTDNGESLEELSQNGRESQQAQATWMLGKIACHTITPKDVVADIPALVKLLKQNSMESSSEYAVRAVAVLRSLSRDVNHKSQIFVAGGLVPLIDLLEIGTETQRVDAAWTLGHLAWNAFSEAQIAKAGAIPPLIELLQSGSVREREGAVWALRHLSCTSDNRNRIGAAAKGIATIVASVRSAVSPCEHEHALATLKNLACSSENQTVIGAAGAIPLLIAVLAKGSASVIIEALATLRNLVRHHPVNQSLVARARGIRPLVELLSTGNDIGLQQQIHAAATLANMASDEDMQNEIVAGGVLPVVLILTESTQTALLEHVAQLLRNLMWCNELIQARIGASGVIPRVVEMLQSDSDGLQKQAAAVVRNLAWQHAANQARIEQTQAVPALIKLVASGTMGQREQAAGAIANLTWNNPSIQEHVARGNGLSPLADLTSRGNEKLQKQAMLAIRHFVFNGNNKVQVAAAGVIPSFVRLLAAAVTPTQQQQATWALANLACNADNKQQIVSAGGIHPLVTVLSKGSTSQRQYAASALANLACSQDHKMKILVYKGVGPLIELVAHGSDGQKKQAAWALRNLAWNCTEGQAAIADANGIRALVKLVETGTEVQKEHAAAALANLACLDENQHKIFKANGINVLVQLANRGTEGQKQQAAWALANIAMSSSNRAAIIDAGGIVALQRMVSSGTPDQQRGASAALARINDPESINNAPNESRAVFRSPSDGSDENDRPLRDLFRVGSSRVNGSNEAPREIKIGRALYRSVGSVPEIVTHSPAAIIEGSETRSPPNRLNKSTSLGGARRTPEYRQHQHVLHHLPSVQETGNDSPTYGASIERSGWSIGGNDLMNPPDAMPLRRARSDNPPTRIAVRMPPSPVEPLRSNRHMLPRPSTLGDLLDPYGGYSPPKEDILRRNIARVQSDMDMINNRSRSPSPVHDRENSPTYSNVQGIQRSPSAVAFRAGRLIRRNQENSNYENQGGSRYELQKEPVIEETPGPMYRQRSGHPAAFIAAQQPHRNAAASDDPTSKFFGSIPPATTIEHSQSANEEVYEYDEDFDISGAATEMESKYPIISL